MNRKRFLLLLALILVATLATVGAAFYLGLLSKKDVPGLAESKLARHSVRLAVVGPMKDEKAAGKGFLRAAQIFADEFNLRQSETDLRLDLVAYDDENDPAKAKQVAEEIAKDPDILGVIGHNFSAASLAAAEVYKALGVPAISPTSTNDLLTKDNPWYFRNIFADSYQGKFLAQYTKTMLAAEQVSVVYEDQNYGSFLANTFLEEARQVGLEVSFSKKYSTDPAQFEAQLDEILGSLKGTGEQGLVFLAGHQAEVAKIIRHLREHQFFGQILVPDAMAQLTFVEAFRGLPKELQHPGYYTDGVYVAAPLLYDSASERAQDFERNYIKLYSIAPDWRAAYAYDAAMMLAQAIEQAKIKGDMMPITERRKRIRDQLASFNQLNASFVGVTGLNYFDEEGNMEKPLSVGQYRHNKLISAPLQMKAAGDPRRIIGLEERIKAGLATQIGDHLYHSTYIVYTGVTFIGFSELEKVAGTYTAEFELWFRYRRGIDVRDIEFCNAVAPIKLRMPVEEVTYGNQIYRRYVVKGAFKTDFVDQKTAEHHNIGVCIVHRNLDRSNLIFVPDVIGGDMFYHPVSRAERVEYKQATGWLAEEFMCRQTTREKPIQGNIKYIHEQSKQVPFSGFFAAISLKAEHSLIRNAFSTRVAVTLLPICFAFLLLFEHRLVLRFWLMPVLKRVLGETKKVKVPVSARPKSGFFYAVDYGETEMIVERPREFDPGLGTWLIKALAILGLIYNFEILVTDYYFRIADMERLAVATEVFDIAWLIVPTVLFLRAFETFAWRKLEGTTGRHIPKFARIFFAATILSLCVFAIMAIVYGETAASILGTSGIFVMIIGMAVQMNISNIFAGLVLNLEKTVRLGDWVQIGEIEEGKVVEISWRTVKIQTREGAIVGIPNNTISESHFHNFTSPNPNTETLFEINLEKSVDYYKVVKVLSESMSSVKEVLEDPKPEVRFSDFTHWSARYTCVYTISNYGHKRQIQARVWEKVIEAFKIHGIQTADFREEPEI